MLFDTGGNKDIYIHLCKTDKGKGSCFITEKAKRRHLYKEQKETQIFIEQKCEA